MKKEDLGWVLPLINRVAPATFRILGGCPRDLALGLDFKDIDVVFAADNSVRHELEYRLSQESIIYGTSLNYHDGVKDNRVDSVVQTTIGIDFIFYQESLENIHKQFDYNINQFELEINTIHDSIVYIPKFIGEQLNHLVLLRDQVPQHRRDKMELYYEKHREKFNDIQKIKTRSDITN